MYETNYECGATSNGTNPAQNLVKIDQELGLYRNCGDLSFNEVKLLNTEHAACVQPKMQPSMFAKS
jgi:hypothetical protein